MSKSSDSYRYVITTFINCKDRCFCTASDTKYLKLITFITGEYVSLKLMQDLYVNPCATSFFLYLTTSVFSFLFQVKPHLNPTRWTLGGVGITVVNTSLFLSKEISILIGSFQLF
jgi:hypothetical protein